MTSEWALKALTSVWFARSTQIKRLGPRSINTYHARLIPTLKKHGVASDGGGKSGGFLPA
jgi:hypothetical protein